MVLIKKTYNGDPSEIVQSFPKLRLQLLCCRLWWLKNWEHRELSYPYWRIYYNRQAGASIIYNQQKIDLNPDTIYLIAPNTRYTSRLYNHCIPENGHVVTGGRIAVITSEEQKLIEEQLAIEHLFIHFTIGFPYDTIAPMIYSFAINEHFQDLLDILSTYFREDKSDIDIHVYLTLHTLISEMLLKIDKHHWEQITSDTRVSKVINHIEQNIADNLSNKKMAELACMATNSFSFLFKKEVHMSLQYFVKKKRINTSCLLLLHSDLSIDEIAERIGFSNRYHFSRIFHEITGNTPAQYRKEYVLSPHL
ncbi:MAG: AraC family transcriptional regulator [Bacteroidaceae bacterium]